MTLSVEDHLGKKYLERLQLEPGTLMPQREAVLEIQLRGEPRVDRVSNSPRDKFPRRASPGSQCCCLLSPAPMRRCIVAGEALPWEGRQVRCESFPLIC